MKDSNESATLADTLSGFTVRRMMPPAVLLAAFLLVGVGIWGPEAGLSPLPKVPPAP